MQALSQLSYGPRSDVSLASVPPRYADPVRKSSRIRRRLRGVSRRIARFAHALLGGGSTGDSSEGRSGGTGLREPRRPLTPSLSGAVALEIPMDETRDARAVAGEPD